MSQRRRLLVTFDAFGTLFTPREPIAKSYADAARKCGISGFTDDQVASSFREAFKQESKKAPNYGKKKGLKAPEWWLNVCGSHDPTPCLCISAIELSPNYIPCTSSLQAYTMETSCLGHTFNVPSFQLICNSTRKFSTKALTALQLFRRLYAVSGRPPLI